MIFKDYIVELAKNYKTYSEVLTRLEDTALIGFEFEYASSATPINAEYADIKKVIETLDEYYQYFDVNHTNRIKQEYEYTIKEYVLEHYEEYLPQKIIDSITTEDGINDDKLDIEVDYFIMHDLTDIEAFDIYIGEKYENIYDFATTNGTPKYGYVKDDEHYIYIEDNQINKIDNMKELNEVLTYIGEKGNTAYKIVNDTSVQGGTAYELITPPLRPSKALDVLEKTLNFISRYRVTNSTTGLHVGISIKDKLTKLNKLKLILFSDESLILKNFNRSNNIYTTPHLSHLSGIAGNAIITKDLSNLNSEAIKELEKILMNNIIIDKYKSINFKKLNLDTPYIEFRMMGNDYADKLTTIKDSIMRYLTAIDVAVDSTRAEDEYHTKLVRFINTIIKTTPWLAKEKTTATERLAKLRQKYKKD